MVTSKAKSAFPPVGAAIFFALVGVALLVGGYQAWRNGDRFALGYWKGRSTVALPFGLGLLLAGCGVLFGNVVNTEHVVTRLLMVASAVMLFLAFVFVLWMPSFLRPGAGGRS
jgi:hypothetical protein